MLPELSVGLSNRSKKEVRQMAIERWQPFTELMSLRQAMDKLFEDSFVRPSRVLAALGEVTVPGPGCLPDTERSSGEGNLARGEA